MKYTSNIYKVIIAVVLLICAPRIAEAQTTWAVSTNALSWVNLGTINAEGAVSVHDHITVNAGFVANPWKMTTPTHVDLQNRQYGLHVGAKYWPWHTFSEWWVGAKIQYKHFRQVGLLSPNLMIGDAIGAGISGGYSVMISNHFNLDFGLGLWGGRLVKYRKYKEQYEDNTRISEQGGRNFLYLDNVMVSLVYVF